MRRLFLLTLMAAHTGDNLAGNQQYEVLSASARASLSKAVADRPAPATIEAATPEAQRWLADMQSRLERRAPGRFSTRESARTFLLAVRYESQRAGLDPQLVLALIDVESGFRKYAVSSAGARGFMQVMPFWVKEIGQPDSNLFSLRGNLRFGCIILRHYLDHERGDLVRALGRYNGSLGKLDYPERVSKALTEYWRWP